MESVNLVDWSPVARLMLVGLLMALGPLAWVWWRSRGKGLSHRLHLLTVLTLFLTFDLVLFGAFTRLSDSGLGCPDWPGCYGSASPIGAKEEIHAAQTAMPTGPVTFSKAWIEMVHRYLATGVGVLIVTLAVATWVQWRQHRRQGPRDADLPMPVAPWLPLLTLVWVCVQGAFGALTVTMKLFPAIVTLHLLGAMVLLVLLTLQAVRYKQAQYGALGAVRVDTGLRAMLGLSLAIVTVQIALGGWVSTNYAVLACEEFPRCQGQWWPPMDFRQGFEIWRELGQTGSGQYLPFPALTAIHMTHRLFALLVLAAGGWTAWRLWRHERLRGHAAWLAGLLVLQVVTGLSNVVLDWPLAAALAHTGGAAALVVTLTASLAGTRQAHNERAPALRERLA